MESYKPVWRMKQVCPCCDEGGLVFLTCPECGDMVVVCEEIGTVFPTTHLRESSALGSVDDPALMCPGCRHVPIAEFRDSTAEEINALGFQPGEYV
jgi:hypothetical protein